MIVDATIHSIKDSLTRYLGKVILSNGTTTAKITSKGELEVSIGAITIASIPVTGTVAVSSLPAIPHDALTASDIVTVANPTANPETGLMKTTDFTAKIDGTLGDDTATPAQYSAKGWLSAIWTKLGSVVATVTGTVNVGTVTTLPAIGGTVAVTTVKPDGTNTAPSMDAAARAGYVKVANALVTELYDNITLSYTGANLTGVVYKLGVAPVATLTLSYTGAVLDSVVKS